jgi:hypothetical protein
VNQIAVYFLIKEEAHFKIMLKIFLGVLVVVSKISSLQQRPIIIITGKRVSRL